MTNVSSVVPRPVHMHHAIMTQGRTMCRTRAYGALSVLSLVRDAAAFLQPGLRWNEGVDLQRVGRHEPPPVSRTIKVGARAVFPSSTLSVARGTSVVMMAKKRRRRRVDDSAPGDSSSKSKPTPSESLQQPSPPQPPQISENKKVEREEQGDDGGDDEDESYGSGVVVPPLPLELGMGAVRTAQELAGEDMFSPSNLVPRTEVPELEMMGGVAGETEVTNKPKKEPKYSFDLDTELPVESEVAQAGKQNLSLGGPTPEGMMPLPDLKDIAKKPRKKAREKKVIEIEESKKVDRSDLAAFTSLLELDPQADSDDRLFTSESYDGFSSFLGEGKPFVGIANSYLQSGHTVLLALTLLCGFVELQGFPLTELPYDVREFLKMGLFVVYVINTAIGVLSYVQAKRIGQPAAFWAFKGFVLGGLAYNELSQIEASKANKPKKRIRRS